VGLRRGAEPRPRRVLRPRRLRDGHAPHARDRRQERLPERAAGLHGLEPGEGAAVVLAALLQRVLHARGDRTGAGAVRPGLRLPGVPQPHPRRLPVDHHPGAGAVGVAGVQPQRDEPGRHQRPRRLQDRLRRAAQPGVHAAPALRDHGRRAGRRLGAVPVDHAVAGGQGAGGHPRQRDARALLRVRAGRLQALRLRRLGGAGRRGRGALRAAGRHHHAGQDRRTAVHRDGGVGGGGRSGHADRCDRGRHRRELDPVLAHHQLSRPLAPVPRGAVHGRRAVLPGRRRRRAAAPRRPSAPRASDRGRDDSPGRPAGPAASATNR
jgi:hypothetical protein